MRREGFELSVSAPQVVLKEMKKDGTGRNELYEPLEEVIIDVGDEYTGSIIEKLSKRKGELKSFDQLSGGKSKLQFIVPMRGLVGYRSELQNETKGSAVMQTLFAGYTPYLGYFDRSDKGAIISINSGKVTSFALEQLQERGIMFVETGDEVYNGMVVGESSKEGDMEVNPCKLKALTNVRSVSKDEFMRLTPAKKMSLEEVIAYVRDDEIIEVTPKTIRLRKKLLDPNDRKRISKSQKMKAQHYAKASS
jgi:GTP-binding protein